MTIKNFKDNKMRTSLELIMLFLVLKGLSSILPKYNPVSPKLPKEPTLTMEKWGYPTTQLDNGRNVGWSNKVGPADTTSQDSSLYESLLEDTLITYQR